MSKGPESNFWNTIRQNLPKKCFATRIENKHGGGVPDVHLIWDGRPFWIELKVSKGNSVNLSAHQVAWNTAYWSRGGDNFILVKTLLQKHLFLFEGDQGARLIQFGLMDLELSGLDVGSGVGVVGSGSGLVGSRFDTVKDLFIYLDTYFMEKKRGAEAPRI